MHHSADGFVLASAESIVVRCQFLDAQGLVGSVASLYRFARYVSKPATPTNAANMPCRHINICINSRTDLVYVFVFVFVGVLVKVGTNFVKRLTVLVKQGVK